MDDTDQIERIRSKLVDFIGSNPTHPDAAQARRILGKLPTAHPSDVPLKPRAPGSPLDEVALQDPTEGLIVGVRRNPAALEEAKQVVRDAGAAGNSFINAYTGGLYGAALRAAGRLSAATGTPNSMASQTAAEIDAYRQRHPIASNVTDAPAYLVNGPVKAIATGIERAIPVATTALGRIGRAGLASAGTNAVIGGTGALTEGASPSEAAGAAGEAALTGLGTGTALSGAGELARNAAGKVLSSAGAKAREFIESRGGEVGPTTPGRGKPFEGMATMGTSDKDIGRQGQISAEKGVEMLRQEQGAVEGAIGRRIGRVAASPEGARQVDVTRLVTKIDDALERVGISPDVKAGLKAVRDDITRAQGPDFNPDVHNYFLTETELNDSRKLLDQFAKAGQAGTAKLHPLRVIADEARGQVRQGPFGEPNASYAEATKHYQQSRRLLGLPARAPGPEESPSAIESVANKITSGGQNTVTAGKRDVKRERFAQRHPYIASELERPELLRKRADLAFSASPVGHGGLIERVAGSVGMGAAPVIMAASHNPSHAAASFLLGLLARNATPIAGRLLYGPAQAVMAAQQPYLEGVPQLSLPLLQAARNAQEGR